MIIGLLRFKFEVRRDCFSRVFHQILTKTMRNEEFFNSGSLHDSNCFTCLLSGDESAAYADSAYQSQAHDDWLCEHGVENRMIKRAYRGRPLTDEDKQFNRLHAGVRCTVERVFGVLKQHYGMAKARYLGVDRNRTRFELMCVAHNIKRGYSIQQVSCA